ncbi:MAG: malto-oligosyltrehalose synthase [Anaerophaga sp.]|nr:malto-oligosyltrehalose synthase [Anaerophaga sp.]
MYNPVSTYRLQFNKAFTFSDALQQSKYFHLLGCGTIYASPVFSATPGSMHGYDVTNPHSINVERGSEQALRKLIKTLKNSRIGWLQDIVPNHMAFNHHNPWLMDVLEKGSDSEYSDFFDIDRQHLKFRQKLMVPFLGRPAGDAVRDHEIKLVWENGTFFLSCFDNYWPIRFESFLWVLEQNTEDIPDSLSLVLEQVRLEDKSPDYLFLNGEWERLKSELKKLSEIDGEVRYFFENLAGHISSDPDAIQSICDNQHYLLTFWKETEQHINYRRFFTVNNLICLRMEDEQVFNYYHRELVNWTNNLLFNGLRIDHIDGLRNPQEYLQRLRGLAGKNTYIVAEKILEQDEKLPHVWPVQGTTGYDFMALVTRLFSYKSGLEQLKNFYNNLTTLSGTPKDITYQAKKFILTRRMEGEWENLTSLFLRLRLLSDEKASSVSREDIKNAIGEILLAMPVYRLYSTSFPLKGHERSIMEKVLEEAQQRNPETQDIINIFSDLFFSGERPGDDTDERLFQFFTRLMQYSGPLMAKGVEDTLMYRYTAFVACNEVGNSPFAEALNPDDFHKKMSERQADMPLTMNATSTHDTKRGEDVRARLNTLTEFPEEWESSVSEWIKINRSFKKNINGKEAPSPSEEYLIYQTLTGTAPFSNDFTDDFTDRVVRFMVKALREAKENSSWSAPHKEWEEVVSNFIRKILSPGSEFLNSFTAIHKKAAHYGIYNSLAQLSLKCTCPGVPDIYQGTELWDLSLVDPDNRRPVDYSILHQTLQELKEMFSLEPARLFRSLDEQPGNGHIKLWLTHRLLKYRKYNSELFAKGKYIPLKIKGLQKKHVLAFARHHKDVWHLTIVPLFLSDFEVHEKRVSPDSADWKNTRVVLPGEAPSDWINVFTGRPYSCGKEISVSEIFESSPVGILFADSGRKGRTAGILMHITSLPGRFGSGDFGIEATRFVRFLKESGHSNWQVLPFTPTSQQSGWSPYSSPSAFAGNIIFISPHKLAEESLIDKKDLRKAEISSSEKADFTKALEIRLKFTHKAFDNFMKHCSPPAKDQFVQFCENEKFWLHDFTLFTLLKQKFDNRSWQQWPVEFRDRDKRALKSFADENEHELMLEKFRQYLFSLQWQDLKRHANHQGIRIIGDIPIYLGYENADVWAHPHLFKLNPDKSMDMIAGVPPDYFSATGQLWNMPVYNWKKHEKEDFYWWIQRIRKNLELFDVIRLDHFRGFAAYWEVPAGEPSAENGRWTKGPGETFFNRLKKEFPAMPFIAEDLGEIDDEVYQLRDKFGLPGMSVLQFAFGDDLPESVHIPHNHRSNSVVYTGTHDNNTTIGWYRNEIDKATKKRIKLYTGSKVKSKNIHHILTRMAWASTARLAIVPVQDLLGKGQEARMNRPSTSQNNWNWRIRSLDELNEIAGNIRELLGLFSR